MTRRVIAFIAAVCLLGTAPQADPHITALAKEWFYRVQSGNIDRSQLAAISNATFPDGWVRQEARHLQWFGKPRSFTYIGTEMVAGATSYDYVLDFSKGRILERIALFPGGMIAGLNFRTFVRNDLKTNPPPAPDQQ